MTFEGNGSPARCWRCRSLTTLGLISAGEQDADLVRRHGESLAQSLRRGVFEPKIKVGLPFWAPLLEMNAAHIWVGLTPAHQKQVHQAVAQAYEPFRDGEHYLLKTHIRVISGQRSGTAA